MTQKSAHPADHAGVNVTSSDRNASAASIQAALWLGATLLGVIAALVPFSAAAPTTMFAVAAVVTFFVACALWLNRRRVPEWVLKALVLVAIIVLSAGITQMKTTTGFAIMALVNVWVALYVAMVFSPRLAFAFVGLQTVTFGVGTLLTDLPHLFTVWLLVSATALIATAALSTLSSQLRKQAATDPLTGVLNRAGLARAAERETSLAGRTGLPLSVVVLDLDGFKAINDQQGHAVGDRILSDAAGAWQRGLRASDILARTGGDEFAMVLPATDLGEAEQLVARLRTLSDVAWSAGAALWEQPEPFDACLARADEALLRVKEQRWGPSHPAQRMRRTSLATRSPERTAPSI